MIYVAIFANFIWIIFLSTQLINVNNPAPGIICVYLEKLWSKRSINILNKYWISPLAIYTCHPLNEEYVAIIYDRCHLTIWLTPKINTL